MKVLFYFPFTDSYLFFKWFNSIPLDQSYKYTTRIVDLNEAKQWCDKSHPKAESITAQVKESYSLLEKKLTDAGAVIAKKERQLKQTLRELLLTTADLFKDKDIRA